MSITVQDLPLTERPRERLQNAGLASLSSQELLALLLCGGISGESVISITQKLLKRYGSLDNMTTASLQSFMQVRGLGLAKAAQLQACFELARRIQLEKNSQNIRNKVLLNNPAMVFYLVQEKISDYNREHFLVLNLSIRNELIATDVISVGTLNMSLVHPREIFSNAISHHAAQIVVAHNHPSGNCEPSDEDKSITKRLQESGKLVGIPLIDHIIFTQKNYLSMRERKILKE